MKTILLLNFLFISIPIFSQNNLSEIDKLLHQANEMELFSGVVLIADNNNIQYLKAFGYSDWDISEANLPDTKFNIGSIGKLFTQIMITQLIQEGKLNLSDNIKKHTPLYNNEYDEKITVKLLLTFSAGLGDYFQIDEFRQNPNQYREVQALTSLIGKQQLLYEPGTSTEYSNSSYVVLGSIIEKVTGKSYEQNLQERILRPLAMTNSGFIYKNSIKENTAKGFIVAATGKKESTYERIPTVPTPAGGMYSTAEDIFKLDRSLLNDNLLLNDTYKALLFNRFNESINLSWEQMKSSPDFGMAVAGGSPGFNSVYEQNIAGGYSVIILSNFDQAAELLIHPVISVLKGEKYPPLKLDTGRFIYKMLKEIGIDDFLKNYEDYLSEYKIENDMILNRTGYQLLNAEMLNEAIAVFTINTKLFPDIANTYDSLAEAFMIKGDNQNAIENYKKSLEFNPNNKNAADMIKKLEDK